MESTDSPMLQRVRHHIRRWPRRVVATMATVIVVLVAARLALPFVVKARVNDRLQRIPGYSGQVLDIDINLLRGAYALSGVSIFRESGAVREPFVLAEKIDFSVAWRELLRGKVVSDIFIDQGQLNFVKAETEQTSQIDADRRWQDVVKDLFPIDITFLELREGTVRYQDKTRTPEIDIHVTKLHVLATGLRNRPGEETEPGQFPAEIVIEGVTLGHGELQATIHADPLAPQPHFHVSAILDNVDLTELNESLKAMANVDVSAGTFQLAAEMAGRDGGFQGYVKPFFEDLEFSNLDDKDESLGTRIWEKIVAGLAWLVKNKPRDEVATRIPFEGRFGDAQVGMWATISNLFRHGFIEAFNPTIEGTIRAANVRPDGKSVDGQDVAEVKDEGRARSDRGPDADRPGAPTGRPSQPATK